MAQRTDSHGHAADTRVNHETTDVDLKGATRLAILSLIVIGVVMVAMYFTLVLIQNYIVSQDPAPPPMADRQMGERLPAVPRLQSVPPSDLKSYRAAEDARLSGRGWVDQGAGVVHIPIERAMNLVVERADKFADPQLANQTAAPAALPATPAGQPEPPKTEPAQGKAEPAQRKTQPAPRKTQPAPRKTQSGSAQ